MEVFKDVDFLRLIVPCRESEVLHQWFEKENLFIIYDCSPNHSSQGVDSFKGSLTVKPDGTYSWHK